MKLINWIKIFIILFAIGLGSVKAWVDYQLHRQTQIAVQKINQKPNLQISYQHIGLSPLGAITIKNAELTLTKLTTLIINRLTLHQAYQFYDNNRWPPTVNITAKNLHFKLPPHSSSPPVLLEAIGYAPYYVDLQELSQLGYAQLNGQAELFATFEEQTAQINLLLITDKWGIYELNATLHQVPSPQQWQRKFKQIQLENLQLSYTDQGLITRSLAYLAQRNGQSLDKFKQRLRGKIIKDLANSPVQLDRIIIESLQKFIQQPKQLVIHLTPSAPLLPLSRLTAIPPENLPTRLGLKITTQK